MAGNVPPPFPPTAHTGPSLAFDQCTLTPMGVSAMVDHLRSHPLLRDVPVARVRAVAIALIASGGSSDGQHRVNSGSLHDASVSVTWQDGLHGEYMKLIMDLLTWGDRISGGSSFLISTQPTRRLGTVPSIQRVKMDVYIPDVLPREYPRTNVVFACMVQKFAEEIGLLAMQHYEEAKSLGRRGAVATPHTSAHVDTQPLIPPSNSPWHTFYGRDPEVLQRFVSEYTAILDAQTQPHAPRPLPLPPTKNTLPPPSSTSTAQRGVSESDGLHWTTEDVKNCATRLEGLGELDNVRRRSILDQISSRLPDILALILDLEHRTRDLELINATQTEEIEELRTALRDIIDERRKELMLIKEQVTGSSVPPPPSSRTFGRQDKAPMPSRRHRAATLDSSLSSVLSATETSPHSLYEPSHAESCTTPTSSVALPSVPPPSRSPSQSSSPYPSTSAYTPSDTLTTIDHTPWKMYGPHTHFVLLREGLPRRLHRDFKFIEDNYAVDDWIAKMSSRIKVSEGLAAELVEAMKFDCGLLE